MNITHDINSESQASAVIPASAPEDTNTPWGALGFAPLEELTEVDDLLIEIAETYELPEFEGYTFKVARGFHQDDMKSLEGSTLDPVPAGHWFSPNPQLGPDEASLSIIAYSKKNPDVPVGYLHINTHIDTDDLEDQYEDVDVFYEMADERGDEWLAEAKKEFAETNWTLSVEPRFLFVDRNHRARGCAAALIELYVAMIHSEIYRLNTLLEAKGDIAIDLSLSVRAEPHGIGGHYATLRFLRSLSELFGPDEESSYFDQLPDMQAIDDVIALSDVYLPNKSKKLAFMLEALRHKLDPRANGAFDWIEVYIQDHVDWE